MQYFRTRNLNGWYECDLITNVKLTCNNWTYEIFSFWMLRFVLERLVSGPHSYLYFIINLITGLFAKSPRSHSLWGKITKPNPWGELGLASSTATTAPTQQHHTRQVSAKFVYQYKKLKYIPTDIRQQNIAALCFNPQWRSEKKRIFSTLYFSQVSCSQVVFT